MRGKVAKRLRRIVYGDMSTRRERREYVVHGRTGAIICKDRLFFGAVKRKYHEGGMKAVYEFIHDAVKAVRPAR